jgi:hypothetical protein
VNETGTSLLAELKAAQQEYDASTRHGVLKGAVLEEF